MLELYDATNKSRTRVNPTIFPDKTSQIWKLDIERLYKSEAVDINWYWEQEAELIWLNQLVDLLFESHINLRNINMPYHPYARQDKEVTNDLTFAKSTFLQMMPRITTPVYTIDKHSSNWPSGIISLPALPYIRQAWTDSGAHVAVFPDKGARERYSESIPAGIPTVYFEKVREQSTGEITGLKLGDDSHVISGKVRFLIIDDLCDGGRTFIEVSKALHENFSTLSVDLYITHGIFSKGLEVLHTEGKIRDIYTTTSLAPFRETHYGMPSFGYPVILPEQEN